MHIRIHIDQLNIKPLKKKHLFQGLIICVTLILLCLRYAFAG